MLQNLMNSSKRRRYWLGLVLALSAVGGWAETGHLPKPQSLPDELAKALRQKQALVVMVSLEGCPFCRRARQSHLLPMHMAGASIVQLDMNSKQTLLDFQGRLSTHDQLIKQWHITVAPTLLFFGPGGQEVAERMEGAYLPDFYGPYLDDRLLKGRQAL
jgi:thioredoxin-related protein